LQQQGQHWTLRLLLLLLLLPCCPATAPVAALVQWPVPPLLQQRWATLC
jgi:hypothetical protein